MDKNNKKKEIKYIQILKDSWKIIWNNKYIWWFGFFIFLGGGGSFNFQVPMGNEEWSEKEINQEKILEVINNQTEWILAGLIFLIAIVIIFLLLGIISQAALIKSVNSVKKGEASNFSLGFKKGRRYFWKLLAINLILGFLILGIMTVLFLPVAFLFYIKSYITASLLLILAILIFIPLMVLVSFLKKYGYFYLVLTKANIRSSIENAYQVFCKNILSSLIMALFLLAIGIIAGLAAGLLIILPLALVFILMGLILYLILAKIGIFIAAVSGILILILIIFLLSSVITAFYQTAWLLFFYEIAAIKNEDVEKVKVEVIGEEKVSPEAEGI